MRFELSFLYIHCSLFLFCLLQPMYLTFIMSCHAELMLVANAPSYITNRHQTFANVWFCSHCSSQFSSVSATPAKTRPSVQDFQLQLQVQVDLCSLIQSTVIRNEAVIVESVGKPLSQAQLFLQFKNCNAFKVLHLAQGSWRRSS